MSATPHLRVLVVEDEWLIADQIAVALEEGGYDVVGPVGRVPEALALVGAQRIDAALVDVNVHGERSFALAERLAEATIPFAFLSGYSTTDMPADFQDRPLLQKPVGAHDVSACMDELLAHGTQAAGR